MVGWLIVILKWETEVVDQLIEMGIDTSGQLRNIVKSVGIPRFVIDLRLTDSHQAVCERNLRPRVDRCPWPDRLKNLLKV